MGLFKKQHSQVRQPRITDDNGAYAFRRSRTMTGSTSDGVRAVAETHADLQSDRLKHHTLRKKRRHLFAYLTMTLALVVGLLLLVNNFMLTVVVKSSGGAPAADAARYEQTINEYLLSHPSERFSFALRGDVLLGTLQQKYPEVRTVTVQVEPWLRPAQVSVKLRTPIASWTIGSTKYYIDTYGVAFQKNYGAEPTLVVEDNTGIDPASTAAVASERMIKYIGRLVALLGQKGLTVERLELPPGTSREVDVYLSGKAYPMKTDIDRDPAGQVVDVSNAVAYLNSHGITPSYADVRVSSRMYYR